MTDDHGLIDRIYEAAINPEGWVDVLERLNELSGSAGSQLFVFDGTLPIGFRATDQIRPITQQVVDQGGRMGLRRIQYFQTDPITGFVRAADYFPPTVEQDDVHQLLLERGLSQQAGTIISIPTGELVILTLNRPDVMGPHPDQTLERLNALHSHVARATAIAARLALERARSAATALETLGVPAGVVGRGGRVLVANSLLESISDRLIPTAHGGVALEHPASNSLLQQALTQGERGFSVVVRSIPLPARDDQPALVVHVMPLRRSALDLFGGGENLLAVTSVRASGMVPSPTVLTGLFDLTPAEAKLSLALVEGLSLKDAANRLGIQHSTARSYLERIFRKTGMHQQSQLVALLASARPLGT